ncbi:peptidoglycan editing factor PgeF [Phyllobacterium phragmitis]|uniref:Purine nucleoside phosphorylase n=1 Tax=Phyllobacterium phragmitis TaxID=2670329 RepID=A0A2S9IXL3_9HYPH|nr:peptidoglycan editing factor PgeF [Phyllobacterium phragmitis]PRD45269.1 peptidoglycan editing factor PgeF [Phyllobacterium phragmitis]
MPTIDRPAPIRSPLLETGDGKYIVHGFFTRQGGVSQGIYHGLNVGAGSHDEPKNVAENRRRVAHSLGVKPENLLTVHQVHSPDVITVTGRFDGERPKADAMVTNTPGIALGALSADCGPVLFADIEARVIGSAHAGWRGAIGGILENTVEAMIALGADRSRIVAVLGPTIGPENYEVGPEFFAEFIAKNASYAHYFSPSRQENYKMFDLWSFILDRLKASGVNADALKKCTYADEAQFFSYRRTTHRNEADYGRQISAIAIVE